MCGGIWLSDIKLLLVSLIQFFQLEYKHNLSQCIVLSYKFHLKMDVRVSGHYRPFHHTLAMTTVYAGSGKSGIDYIQLW